MKYLIAVMAFVLMLAGQSFAGETSFNGGLGGLFVFEGDGVFDVSAYSLGVTYRPDRSEIVEVPKRIVKASGEVATVTTLTAVTERSPLIFWTNRAVRDGAGDIDFIGLGYSVWRAYWAGVEIIPEIAGTIKYLENDKAKLGAYGGIRVPFAVNTQSYRLVFGGGWDGDAPLVTVALNFATK